MKSFDTEDETHDEEESAQASANLLDSKTSQLSDILEEKLENAFHKQTTTLALHHVVKIVSEHSPVDLSYAARRLPVEDRLVIYENLNDISDKISFLIHADSATRVAIFRRIPNVESKEVIENMPPDEAVNVLESISERRYRRVLELLDPKKASKIREINKHSRNTAGRLMTNEFFSFPMDATIEEVSNKIRNEPGTDLSMWIFVVNAAGELQGYVPVRNLIINPQQLPLKQVMKSLSHTVSPETSREEVVEIVDRYKICVLPVVNSSDVPIGVLNYEDVIEALEDISDETIATMAGTVEKVTERESLLRKFLSRAPWLFVTLCAGLINVGVMSSFQAYEKGLLTFVFFFVPLITGMSGNIGIQCSTILVRSMAMGLLSMGNRREAIFKESVIGIGAGVVFGILCGLAVYCLDFVGTAGVVIEPLLVGLIVGVGLMGSCVAGTLLGVFSPLFFARMGIDPAVASGPIVTAFNDFLSMSIYFLIAIGLSSFLL
jgi:magnesium transporter